MKYGRTFLEVIVTQAAILTAFLIAPFDLVEFIGTTASGVFAMALVGITGPVLYARHRGRMVQREFGRKIERLRQAAVA